MEIKFIFTAFATDLMPSLPAIGSPNWKTSAPSLNLSPRMSYPVPNWKHPLLAAEISVGRMPRCSRRRRRANEVG